MHTVDQEKFGVKKFHKPYTFTKLKLTKVFIMKIFY